MVTKKPAKIPGLPVCTAPADGCSSLTEAYLLFRRIKWGRTVYLLFLWSSVKNGYITAGRVIPDPKNIRLNSPQFWPLGDSDNSKKSQLKPFCKTQCFEGQGCPCFHVISHIPITTNIPWTDLATSAPTENVWQWQKME